MKLDQIKAAIRKIEKSYDYNHEYEDYDVVVNLTEMANLIQKIEKDAYERGKATNTYENRRISLEEEFER